MLVIIASEASYIRYNMRQTALPSVNLSAVLLDNDKCRRETQEPLLHLVSDSLGFDSPAIALISIFSVPRLTKTF